MKLRKVLFLALFVVMLVTVLTSCSSIKCMKPFNLHTVVIDKAVAPTCAEVGYTEGSHCADCGKIFVAQSIISKLPHTVVVDAAVDPTCTKVGLTEGKHCSVCDSVLVKQKEIAMKPHNESIIPAVAATCTTDGSTEGKQCLDCKKVIVASKKIDKGHRNVQIIEAKDSTCTSVGHTEGKFCHDCDKIFEGYQMIPKKAHAYGDWIVETEKGMKYHTCAVCGNVATESIVPYVFDWTVNSDGESYTITGVQNPSAVLYLPEYIDGHKVTAIGNGAFRDAQIIAVYIPEGVEIIGDYAFYGCENLTSVILPNSITNIGDSAFGMCGNLQGVYYRGNAEMWNNVAIGNDNDSINVVDNRYYYFIEDPRKTETGIFNEDGKLYFFLKGAKTGAGLMLIDGAYYYAHEKTDADAAKGEIIVNQWHWIDEENTNGLLARGWYYFGADGKITSVQTASGKDTVEINRYWHFVDGVPTVW